MNQEKVNPLWERFAKTPNTFGTNSENSTTATTTTTPNHSTKSAPAAITSTPTTKEGGSAAMDTNTRIVNARMSTPTRNRVMSTSPLPSNVVVYSSTLLPPDEEKNSAKPNIIKPRSVRAVSDTTTDNDDEEEEEYYHDEQEYDDDDEDEDEEEDDEEYDDEDDNDDTLDNDTRTSNTYSKTDHTISTMGGGSSSCTNSMIRMKGQHHMYHRNNATAVQPVSDGHGNNNMMITPVSRSTTSIQSNTCNVTESLCGFGYDITKSRQEPMTLLQQQQQQRSMMTSATATATNNDTTTNHKKKRGNTSLRELQRRNYQLYHRNRLLEAEKQQYEQKQKDLESPPVQKPEQQPHAHEKDVEPTYQSEIEALKMELQSVKEQYEAQAKVEESSSMNSLLGTDTESVDHSNHNNVSNVVLPTLIGSDYAALLQERDATIAALCEQVSILQQPQQNIVIETDANKTILAPVSLLTDETTCIDSKATKSQLYSLPRNDDASVIEKYKEQMAELEQANAQLEIDNRDAVDHMEYTKQYYSDVLHEIETKYGTMEHQLLQTKLQLAAIQESNEQLTEEHNNTISILKQEKDELVLELKRCVAETYTANELNSSTKTEHKNRIDHMEKEIQSLQKERTQLIQMIERMKHDDNEEKKTIDGTTHENDHLRMQLQETQKIIDDLRTQLLLAFEQQASTAETSSRNMKEHDPTTQSPQPTVDQLTTKIKQLKKRLYVAKNENSRYRAQLILNAKSSNENPATLLLSYENVGAMKVNQSSDDITEDTADMLLEDDTESEISELSTRRLLKERDDAISSLVKQAVQQDDTISNLRAEIKVLNDESVPSTKAQESTTNEPVSSIDDTEAIVEQLQKEAEVFACQVIELDDEIEQLRTIIAQHERHISDLEKQVHETKQQQQSLVVNSNDRSIEMNVNDEITKSTKRESTLKILDLEAEIDELKEANMTQRNELRDLRRKALYSDSTTDEIVNVRNETMELKDAIEHQRTTIQQLNQEKSTLIDELNAERTNKKELESEMRRDLQFAQESHKQQVLLLEKKIDESRWSLDELKASPGHMSEDAVKALRDEIDTLRQSLASQSDDLRVAKLNVQELEEILADQSTRDAATFEEEKEELFAEIESLTQRLHDTDEKISVLEADTGIIADFKDKLERADEARETSEKNIIDTFERRISLLTLDKDVTIDKLRKELVIEKESTAEEMEGLMMQLKTYQLEISELHEEMKEQIEHREARIYTLEATLTAQEQLIGNMKTEMDQLQGSMENSVARRKDENDELQQELLAISATSAKQEREITTLKLEMEAKSFEYQSTISKLEQKIASLERAPTELRNAQDLQMELRVKEVKDRLEKLKWRNASLKDENMNLRERLEQADALAQASSDNNRTKELEEQLTKQLLTVKSLELELQKAPTDPTSTARELSSPTGPITETDIAPSSANVNVMDAVSSMEVIISPLKEAAASSNTDTRKVSAPSPSRRGLKLFGRK